MTHTLHPEIEEAIKQARYSVGSDGDMDIDMFENIILKYLGPYLHMPKPIENEPNHDAACMYVVAHGLNITAEDVKGILKASSVPTNQKDKEPLPKKCMHRFFLSHSGVVDLYTCHFCGIQQEKSEMEDDLKQSTPQIETDRIDEAFKFYYEGENLYAFEECRDADKRIFREAILKHQPECQTCSMNKIAMKNPGKQS